MDKIEFGVTREGDIASKYILKNKAGMELEVSDFGALVLAIRVPDKNKNLRDIVLGFETLDNYYDTATGFGAYVGRNANRIQGANVVIEGENYQLDINDNDNNLHSGFDRSHCKFYQTLHGENAEGAYVEFERISPHMEQGFPGNLEQKIRYTLTENSEFIIDYEMVSDKTTVINPTNHSYFNLNGHDSGDILGHELEIYSEAYLPTDKQLIPTGEIFSVQGTPMDFRLKKAVGRDIDSEYEQLKLAGGYDHNYIFKNDRELKLVAKLYGNDSGIIMSIFSDLCGMQVYSGNFLEGEKGKDGTTYGRRSGICFETQFYPNSCKDKRFPSCMVLAENMFHSRTIYRFE